MVKFEIITPKEYQQNSSKYNICYTFIETPFGKCIIGVIKVHEFFKPMIVHLAFVEQGLEEVSTKNLKTHWPRSSLIHDLHKKIITIEYVDEIFSHKTYLTNEEIIILLKGTPFEIKVWTSLISVTPGTTITYEDLAKTIDNPKAVRAVANALAKNQIACLIPCHRVMGKNGSNKYSWGSEKKLNILKFERSFLSNKGE